MIVTVTSTAGHTSSIGDMIETQCQNVSKGVTMRNTKRPEIGREKKDEFSIGNLKKNAKELFLMYPWHTPHPKNTGTFDLRNSPTE
eukprot:2999858-Amphidinium_carterae.1